MIICDRPDAPDDHFQEAGSSGWSFAMMQRRVKIKSAEQIEADFKRDKEKTE